ncbi:DUF1643 domain-containing protein [Neobacillus sp. PS3-40]|uniref:DUF1643 domain-containing protein n=1 Tax=Neobacillus sp. PS3-40 TaxID=3070679 RepID=UPI0027E168CE|nr:DUF1643 domain-containing protein [Neobacillus sp. PS3-40]WML44267.1 DUF1643 domain-containing protein [Neobacillus sp. PS3-40]
MEKEAVIDGEYRYSLKRIWDRDNPRKAVFIMLNPSTADETIDDPTTIRCISFAKRWNCGALEIVNVFAYKVSNYKQLKSLSKIEATGIDNGVYIEEALNNSIMKVVAWGEHVTMHHKNYQELSEQLKGHKLVCLGTTREGHPRNPLSVKSTTNLEPFNFS